MKILVSIVLLLYSFGSYAEMFTEVSSTTAKEFSEISKIIYACPFQDNIGDLKIEVPCGQTLTDTIYKFYDIDTGFFCIINNRTLTVDITNYSLHEYEIKECGQDFQNLPTIESSSDLTGKEFVLHEGNHYNWFGIIRIPTEPMVIRYQIFYYGGVFLKQDTYNKFFTYYIE